MDKRELWQWMQANGMAKEIDFGKFYMGLVDGGLNPGKPEISNTDNLVMFKTHTPYKHMSWWSE